MAACGFLLFLIFVIAILSVFYFSTSIISLTLFIWSWVKWGFWMSLYTILIWLFATLFIIMANYIHKLGYEILKMKEENRNVYKKSELQSNFKQLAFNIFISLTFMALSLFTANYSEVWYLKYPFVLYICWVLGYVTSYPLKQEEIDQLISKNTSLITDHPQLFLKTIANSVIFFLTYFSYRLYNLYSN